MAQNDLNVGGDTTANPSPSVATVSIKPPPFWKDMPAIWFDRLEAQFHLAHITSQQTRFYHVLSVLEGDVIRLVTDVIRNPSPSHPYDRLKETLITRLSASESSKINQLLNDITLGDRHPSQLLREMRELGGDTVSEDLLRTLWFQRLPENMQTILACNTSSLNELASCADKISEISGRNCITAFSSPQVNFNNTSIENLNSRLENLEKKFNKLFRARSSSRQRSNSRSSLSKSIDKNLCWYHTKFGSNANKCIKPCDMYYDFLNKSQNLSSESKK